MRINEQFGAATESGDYYKRREETMRALRVRLCEWPSCGSTEGVAPIYVPRAPGLSLEPPWLCSECRQRITRITVTSSLNSDGETDSNVEVSI